MDGENSSVVKKTVEALLSLVLYLPFGSSGKRESIKLMDFSVIFLALPIHKVVHECNESCTNCTTKGIRTTAKKSSPLRFISYTETIKKLILLFLFFYDKK